MNNRQQTMTAIAVAMLQGNGKYTVDGIIRNSTIIADAIIAAAGEGEPKPAPVPSVEEIAHFIKSNIELGHISLAQRLHRWLTERNNPSQL